ncbi:amidohydrolase family protein [Streptomyces sp. NPDC001027]|uniref:amidohydrolase family protein n=1 Tax=Streptomyces sp. NPDC001027 TaxID=3154771 RepID=UPI0033247EF1
MSDNSQRSVQNQTDFSRTQPPKEQWLAKALPESAIEPDLPIVDGHVHLWHHASGYCYFAQEYARDVESSGHYVEASIYVECNSMYRADGPPHLRPVGETEFAVGMSAIGASGKYTRSRIAAGVIGYADLLDGPTVGELLDAHVEAANGRFRGVRQRAKWDPDPAVRGPVSANGPGLFLEPAFHAGLAEVAARGLTFEASIFHPQLSDVTALARAVPEASIVLIHTGSPVGHSSYAGRETEVRAAWLAGMRELARCENVTVKMGGLLMPLANFDFGVADRPPTSQELAAHWGPFIEGSVEAFGADRCMVGSNFPVDKAGCTYGTLWNTYKRVLAECSPAEKKAIFSETARRTYRI